jgi:hypothetical protein
MRIFKNNCEFKARLRYETWKANYFFGQHFFSKDYSIEFLARKRVYINITTLKPIRFVIII